ncbi:hypothetical protein NM208_g16301 [Fusarium decemcellulare]|uniref:Uncharacterized protein n=1 Tax=Fusarium decemcellulare TaxID=57161 RepID=A0ACC1RB49_9HYPO|nr:hypothetical protein NM208_g16301 [Fusarium decemcellulare]
MSCHRLMSLENWRSKVQKCWSTASPLAPLVQKYIDDDLAIKIKIPDLRFIDDGALTGGAQDGSDIFANVKERALTPPDVLVGPDSNLFNRGVLGRHYSLAKYFPWMAEKFGLSSKSVFACLSGIAHDPIQRGHDAPVLGRSVSDTRQGGYLAREVESSTARDSETDFTSQGTSENIDRTGISHRQIRGFRVELNGVDANLGGSRLIRDCKTLARRDCNEEPTLVSYIVLEITEWKRWLETQGLQDIEEEGMEMGPCIVYLKKRSRRIQAEVRDHLKSRLPAHSVPSIYIVMQNLPLDPNGKIGSPNLPFPDTSHDGGCLGGGSQERDQTQVSLTAVATVFLAKQLLLNIRKNLGVDITIGVLYEVPELDDRNAVAILRADADRWIGIDDSAGEGITREDIGRYLRYLVEIKFMAAPTGRGRELPAIDASIAEALA